MAISESTESKSSQIAKQKDLDPQKSPERKEKRILKSGRKRQFFSGFHALFIALFALGVYFFNKNDFLKPNANKSHHRVARQMPPRGKLVLEECDQYNAPFVCGWLGAPLDYTNLNDPRNASVAVIIYPAGGGKTPSEEVLGSLLLNPGGPGVSGVWFVGEGKWYNESLVEHLDRVLEGKYHLVGFDPRGTGNTYPQTNCFSGQESEKQLAYYSALAATGFPGFNTEDRQDFEIGTLLAQKRLLAQLCLESEDAELLEFMGTPFVARDMELLHRALGDDKLNYWGFSYGTVIGSTYADMFPSDVGRIVLDGVIEMPDYYSGRWWTSLQDIDEELEQFFGECERSSKCQLNSVSIEPGTLMKTVMNWLNDLKMEPGYTIGCSNCDMLIPPQLVTHSSVMLTFFEILREPIKWPGLADAIHAAMTKGDFSGLGRPAGPGEESEEYYAIGCSDSLSPPREFGIEDYKKHSEPLLKDSALFGDLFSPSGVMCTGIWPIRAVERHYGNFTSETSFPLLVLGNDFDPVTPGKCADDLAGTFPNAVSVRRAGFGHCSFSQPSKCIDDIAHDYFVLGRLPNQHTRCEVDLAAFG